MEVLRLDGRLLPACTLFPLIEDPFVGLDLLEFRVLMALLKGLELSLRPFDVYYLN